MEQKEIQKLIDKIKKAKESGTVDLSTEEDLSIGVMNLISLEEHFFFTVQKTGKDSYYELLKSVRDIRKEMLAKLIPQNEGETWCISKHLLAATMRFMEVGTKLSADKKDKLAKEMFDRAYELYTLFWGVRLRLIDLPEFNKMAAADKPWTLRDITNNLVDCCDE